MSEEGEKVEEDKRERSGRVEEGGGRWGGGEVTSCWIGVASMACSPLGSSLGRRGRACENGRRRKVSVRAEAN